MGEEVVKNSNGAFYLLGAVFGALTGGFIAENFLGLAAGAIAGLIAASLFIRILLPPREHDR
jgi:uncharacterized membrane protein